MILKKEYRDDLKDAILAKPPETFAALNVDAGQVVADDDLMERLWVVYQKNVEEYDCDPEWSVDDALHEVLGIETGASAP